MNRYEMRELAISSFRIWKWCSFLESTKWWNNSALLQLNTINVKMQWTDIKCKNSSIHCQQEGCNCNGLYMYIPDSRMKHVSHSSLHRSCTKDDILCWHFHRHAPWSLIPKYWMCTQSHPACYVHCNLFVFLSPFIFLHQQLLTLFLRQTNPPI